MNFPWTFEQVVVCVVPLGLVQDPDVVSPFPLCVQVVVVDPPGLTPPFAAMTELIASGAIDIATVAAINAAAIASVFVSICNYHRYGFLHKSYWKLFLYINTL